MATLTDAFSTTITEDAPVNTSQSNTSAGELRLFGMTHIPYETFMIILVVIAALFITLKIVLHRHYKKKGIYPYKKRG